MYHKFRKHLTLSYTVTTGLILTVILSVCFFYMHASLQAKNASSFSSLFFTIASKIQTENTISDQWLGQMETDNELIIHIEENGSPLLFQGNYQTKTPRDTLIMQAKQYALAQAVNTQAAPMDSSAVKTSMFQVRGNFHDTYNAIVLVTGKDQVFRSLVLLKDNQAVKMQTLKQGLFFLGIDFLGILLLFLASWHFVGRSMEPLKENQKKQNDFIAAASHELRSPIAVIQASASAISASPDTTSQMVHNIEQECVRTGKLIKDLLFLASSQSGRFQVHSAWEDADTLLLETYEAFQPLCRKKGILLKLHLPQEELPLIYCDKDRVQQIFAILIDNAITYSPRGQSVELSSSANKNSLSFAVCDHGTGISDEEKPYIFDRFYRCDQSRKQKEHFGLGLSIARELAMAQKAKLLLKDTPCGGCTFILIFPCNPWRK